MFADEASDFLADFGAPVTWYPSSRALTRQGPMIFDMPTESIGGGADLSAQYSVLFETAAWPGLKRGEVLIIGGPIARGQRYTLRTDPRPQDDGVFSQVELTLVKS